MDALMASTTLITSGAYPTWDFAYRNGCVPCIEGDEEKEQRAEIACFIQKGLIPQIPFVGIDWVAFFLKQVSFADIDSQIRQMLIAIDATEFSPVYSASDDVLIVTVQRGEE